MKKKATQPNKSSVTTTTLKLPPTSKEFEKIYKEVHDKFFGFLAGTETHGVELHVTAHICLVISANIIGIDCGELHLRETLNSIAINFPPNTAKQKSTIMPILAEFAKSRLTKTKNHLTDDCSHPAFYPWGSEGWCQLCRAKAFGGT